MSGLPGTEPAGQTRSAVHGKLLVGAAALGVVCIFSMGVYVDGSSEYPGEASHCSAFRSHQMRCEVCAADYVPQVTVGTASAEKLATTECRAVPLGGVRPDAPVIPAAVEFAWDSVEPVDIATQGCAPEARRYHVQVARFVLAEVAGNAAYCMECDALVDTLPACWASFDLSSEPALPPPDVQVGYVGIEPGGGGDSCVDDALILEIRGIHPPFFEEGGYVEVEYDESRHDVAHFFTDSRPTYFNEYPPDRDATVEWARFAFFAPLPEDEEIRVRAVNAAGVAGPWLAVDVRGLGSTSVERQGCSMTPSPAGNGGRFALMTLLLLAWWRRRWTPGARVGHRVSP